MLHTLMMLQEESTLYMVIILSKKCALTEKQAPGDVQVPRVVMFSVNDLRWDDCPI